MGCGKSSVGRRLSELLCCRFMDLDSVIEEREGRSIPEIFASDGEAAFRNIEKTVLSYIISANTERLIAPLAPSHFVGPGRSCCRRLLAAKVHWTICPVAHDPYAGVRKCQFRKTATPQLPAEIITDNNSSQETADCPNTNAPEEMLVVALGGGTVMTPECAELVHDSTLCIYLKASLETLVRNLDGEAEGRPMLQPDRHSVRSDGPVVVPQSAEAGSPAKQLRERIEGLMALRCSTYEKTAHVIIDTDGRSIDTIAQKIMQKITQVRRVRGDL